jgi:hypothetical protein
VIPVFAFTSKGEIKMNRPQQELTLANVLTDPMVRLAMAADHVNPRELAAMLAGVATVLRHREQTGDFKPCSCAA